MKGNDAFDRFSDLVVGRRGTCSNANASCISRQPSTRHNVFTVPRRLVTDFVEAQHTCCILNVVSRTELGCDLGKIGRIAAVVPTDNDDQIWFLLPKREDRVLPVLRGAANGVEGVKP